jgi:hypothetical protein
LEAIGYLSVEERRYDVRIDHSPGMPVTYYVWRFEPTRHDADLTQFRMLDQPFREKHAKPFTRY